jgi:hypothetical protein
MELGNGRSDMKIVISAETKRSGETSQVIRKRYFTAEEQVEFGALLAEHLKRIGA